MDLIELDTLNECVPIIAKPLIPSPINNSESNCIFQNGLIGQDNLNNNPFDKVLYETNCNVTKENDPFENVFAKSLHNQRSPKSSSTPVWLLQPLKSLNDNKLLVKIDDSNDSKGLEKGCVIEDKLIEIDQSLRCTDNFLLSKNPILKRKDLQHVINDFNTSNETANASVASLNDSSLQCLSNSILEEDKLLTDKLKRKDLKKVTNGLNMSNRSINEFVASFENTSLQCLSDSILNQNKSISGKLRRKDLQHVVGDLNLSNRSENAFVASVNNSSLQCLNDSVFEQDKSFFEKLPESEGNESCQETSRETRESQWVRRSFSLNYNDNNSDCPDRLSMLTNSVAKPNAIIQKTAELKRPEFRRSWSADCFQNVNTSVKYRSNSELDKVISDLKSLKNEVIGSVSSQGTLNRAFLSMDEDTQSIKTSSSQSDLSKIGSSFLKNNFIKESHSLNTVHRANKSNFFVSDRQKNLHTKSLCNANEIFNATAEEFDDSVFVEANNLADTFSKLAGSAIDSSSDADDILNVKPPDWNAVNLSAEEDKPTKDVFQIIDKIFPETEKNGLNLKSAEENVDIDNSPKSSTTIDLLSPVNPLPTLAEGNQNTDCLLKALRNFVSKNEGQMVDESTIIKLSKVLNNNEQPNEIDNITRDTVFNLQEKVHFLEEQLKTFMSHDSKQLNKESDTVNENNDQCEKLVSENVIKLEKVVPLQIVQNNPLSVGLKKVTESKNLLDKIKFKRNIGNAANVEKRRPLKAVVPIGVMVKEPVTKDKPVKNTRKLSIINATPPRTSKSKTNAPLISNTPENINRKPMKPVAQSTPNNRKEDISHAMSSPSSPLQQQLSRNSWHFNKSVSPAPVGPNIVPNVSSLHRKRTSDIEPRSLPRPMYRKSYSSIPTVKSTMTRVKSTGDIEINRSLDKSIDRQANKSDVKTVKSSLDNTASRKLSVLSSVNRDRKSTSSFFGNKLRPVNLISKLHSGSFAKGKENIVPE